MKTILVIDDEISIRDLYRLLFEEEGFSVLVSPDVKHAWSIVKDTPPDLITLDIHLDTPSDGLSFLYKLRENQISIPVVLLTGYEINRQNFQTWAADAFVLKSSDPKKLLKTIRNLLN